MGMTEKPVLPTHRQLASIARSETLISAERRLHSQFKTISQNRHRHYSKIQWKYTHENKYHRKQTSRLISHNLPTKQDAHQRKPSRIRGRGRNEKSKVDRATAMVCSVRYKVAVSAQVHQPSSQSDSSFSRSTFPSATGRGSSHQRKRSLPRVPLQSGATGYTWTHAPTGKERQL